MTHMDFVEFPKIARLSRECTITEKIDGTNGCIGIGEDGTFKVGSRSRWLDSTTGDNHGFMLWALQNKDELMKLGPGRHYGEWWGSGIQRGYGLQKGEKRFSLFNTYKWSDALGQRPACCSVVPVLFNGLFTSEAAESAIALLAAEGSKAAPWFMLPEGVIIYHHAANLYFKKTLSKDEEWKGKQAA
jgi:hypothetical protein